MLCGELVNGGLASPGTVQVPCLGLYALPGCLLRAGGGGLSSPYLPILAEFLAAKYIEELRLAAAAAAEICPMDCFDDLELQDDPTELDFHINDLEFQRQLNDDSNKLELQLGLKDLEFQRQLQDDSNKLELQLRLKDLEFQLELQNDPKELEFQLQLQNDPNELELQLQDDLNEDVLLGECQHLILYMIYWFIG